MTFVQLFPRYPDPVDPGPGEHLWIFTTAHKMSADVARALANGETPERVDLDHESVLIPPQPGCYKCGEHFDRRTFYRKCTGTMEDQ